MPRKSTRTGDAASLLALLWTPQQAVGRTGVTVAAITRAAVGVADAEGLDAVTMRRVAASVGVGTMTLYTYVPGRAELLELMLDLVAATVYEGHRLPGELDGWRGGVEYLARRNWEHALAHPWTVEIPPGRPILGPGVSVKYDRELAPLDGVGLSDHAMDHLLTTVLALVAHAARWQTSLERTRAGSALTDRQWWELAEPVLAAESADTPMPLAGRVGESVASAGDPWGSLEFGLAALLDGVEQMLA